MANKYTLELQADATIAQRGTESEKKALREQLKSQLESWGSVYQENNIESLWNKLGRVDLGDQETRKEIREFVANERKLKGGDAGAEFERPFQIIEANIKLADQAAEKRDTDKGAATATAEKAKESLKQEASPKSRPHSDRLRDIEKRSVAYNREMVADNAALLKDILEKIRSKHPDLAGKLEIALKNPERTPVMNMQQAIRKILPESIVSPIDRAAKGGPDGWFGPLTIGVLASLAGVTPGSDIPMPKKEESKKEEPKSQESEKPAPKTTDKSAKPAEKKQGDIVVEGGEIMTLTGTKVFYKDGAYYLTGPKGSPTQVTYGEILTKFGVPKEAGENLMKSSKSAANFAFLLEALMMKSSAKREKVQSAVAALEKRMSDADVQSGKKTFSVDWELVSLLALDGNSRAGTKRGSKSESLLQIFGPMNNPEQQRALLVKYVRDELDQSDFAAADIIDRKWASSIGAISNEYLVQLTNDLQAGNSYNATPEYRMLFSKIGQEGMEKLFKTLRSASAQADEDWQKNSQSYVKQFKAQSGFTGNIDAMQLAKARESFRAMSIGTIGKKEVMYRYLSKDAGIMGGNSKDTEMQTLEKILGVGTLRMSDRAWDITGEVASFMAVEAIAIAAGVFTGGLATAGINAMAFGRNAYRGTQLVEAYNAASKAKKAGVWIGRATLGMGAGFEVGAAGVRSIHEGKNMYSKEGFSQSIAMGTVLHGLNGFFASSKAPAFLKLQAGEGFWKNVRPFTSQVVIEGAAITGTAGLVGKYVFEKDHAWSPEEMAQAILMAAIFKGAPMAGQKMTAIFRKGPNGGIEAQLANEAPAVSAGGASEANRTARTAPANATEPLAIRDLTGKNTPERNMRAADLKRERQARDLNRLRNEKNKLVLERMDIDENIVRLDKAKADGDENFTLLFADGTARKASIKTQGEFDMLRAAMQDARSQGDARIMELREKIRILNGKMNSESAPTDGTAPAGEPVNSEAPTHADTVGTAPAGTPESRAAAGPTPEYKKFFRALREGFKKDGDSQTIGNVKITLKDGEYSYVVQGERGAAQSQKSFKGFKDLEAVLKSAYETNPQAFLDASLGKGFSTRMEKMAKEAFRVEGQEYRFMGATKDGFHLERKNSDGSYSKMTAEDLSALSPKEVDALLDRGLGKGASGKIDAAFERAYEKIKNTSVKDYFTKEKLKKIPKWLWNHSVGNMMSELGHSLHLKGLGKLEVLRTLYTGRSSHGNLVFHGGTDSHGHHVSSMIPMSAWMPSFGVLATTGLITGVEVYQNNKDDIHGTEDMINALYDNQTEFAKNYFQFIYLNWIGTAIIEGSETLSTVKDAAKFTWKTVKNTVGRVGEDGSPTEKPSFAERATDGINTAKQRATDGINAVKQRATDAINAEKTDNGEVAAPIVAPEERDRIVDEDAKKI